MPRQEKARTVGASLAASRCGTVSPLAMNHGRQIRVERQLDESRGMPEVAGSSGQGGGIGRTGSSTGMRALSYGPCEFWYRNEQFIAADTGPLRPLSLLVSIRPAASIPVSGPAALVPWYRFEPTGSVPRAGRSPESCLETWGTPVSRLPRSRLRGDEPYLAISKSLTGWH